VYGASKTQGEQELWQLARESKSDIVVNTILPNTNWGHIIDPEHQGFPSTCSFIRFLFNGNAEMFHALVTPQYQVDV